MTLDFPHPRLLLAATLLCTFSVLGMIGYHASPSPAAAAYLPAATPAEIETVLAESRKRIADATPSPRTAVGAAAVAAARAAAEPAPAAKPAAPADVAAAAPADPAAYTLNPLGPGLLPTAAPGDFVNAEPEPVQPAASAELPSTRADAEARGFRMPVSRRPGSSGRR